MLSFLAANEGVFGIFTIGLDHSGAAVSTVASQQEGFGFDSGSGLFCGEFAFLPVPAWVLSGYTSFLPQSKNMQSRD